MKRLSDTLAYRGIASEAVFTEPPLHHRSIGMAPVEVSVDNEDVVRNRLYPQKPKSYKWKYNVGDRVRISIFMPSHQSQTLDEFENG